MLYVITIGIVSVIATLWFRQVKQEIADDLSDNPETRRRRDRRVAQILASSYL